MRSKLRATQLATAAGESVILANGSRSGILDEIFAGEPVGTLFLPHGSTVPAWKRWLGFTARPRGKIVVDVGARQAIEHLGRSLLPIGVRDVTGSFSKGDVLSICDQDNVEFARGLTNYPDEALRKILGLRTEQIAAVLGAVPYEEVVHRDNLVVVL
jgi:glutamate 5-kinase